MALTEGEIATYTAYLEAAEKAYHQLVIGGSVRVFVDQNSERIEYTAVNRNALLTYINQLRAALGKDPYPVFTVAFPAGVIL